MDVSPPEFREVRPREALAVLELPGDVDMWREELADAIRQLEQQTVAQRLDELRAAQAAGQLDEAMKAELRDLLARRAG